LTIKHKVFLPCEISITKKGKVNDKERPSGEENLLSGYYFNTWKKDALT
jgi:hypothetical protein